MPDSQPAPSVARRDFFESLTPRREQVGYALLAAAALAGLGIPIAAYLRYNLAGGLLMCWGVAVGVVFLGVGIYCLVPRPPDSRTSEADRLRVGALCLGGGVGFFTALLGLLMPFYMPGYSDVFSLGIEEWRKRPQALVWTALALFGGLGLMFLGLSLARTFVRTSAPLRRLMYGYNAVLTSLLLFVVLGLANVLPYSGVAPFNLLGKRYDWTSTRIYTLDASSVNQLKELKEPVKVYVLLRSQDRVIGDVETLLQNCRDVTPQLSFKFLSPDRDPSGFATLRGRYRFNERFGLLVVYGDENSPVWDFIRRRDLKQGGSGFDEDDDEAGSTIAFTGENALMKSLDYLASGKARSQVYFVQSDPAPEPRGRAPAGDLAGLKRLLAQGNIEPHDLRFGPSATRVPEDADVVVVARPRQLPPVAVAALTDYMKGARAKKGKMIVLLNADVADGKMVKTGLEPLLGEFGVRLPEERVLTINDPPTYLRAFANPRSTSPLAKALIPNGALLPFIFRDARPVEAAPAGPGAPFTAEVLIVADPSIGIWKETRLDADPEKLAGQIRADAKKLDDLSDVPLPLAVAVTEPKGAGGPHGFMQSEQTPRLIVFGDASWAADDGLTMARSQFTLFSSSLSWLRERPDMGEKVPPQKRDEYALPETVAKGSVARLLWLPGGLLMLAIIGLGLGVWVVRRR